MRSLLHSVVLGLLLGTQAAVGQLAWTQLAPSASPQARTGHKMAFHPTRSRMVLFGGHSSTGALLDDTWEFDGTTWRPVPQIARPVRRAFHTMVYDPGRDGIILFGGSSGIALNDTWIYSSQGRWSPLTVVGNAPSPRAGHVAFSDPANGAMVVLGGSASSTTRGDQYQLDPDGTWRVSSVQSPTRAFAGIAVDADRGVAVLTGGILNATQLADTWEWSRGGWVQVSPNNNLAVSAIDLAYDPIRGRTVYFGGATAAAQLTASHGEFATGSWSLLGIARPPARADAALAFDPNLGKVLLFGGTGGGGPLGDTWMLGSRLDAEVLLFGSPCGTTGVRLDTRLAGARPWIGSSLDLRLSSLPNPTAAALFLGASDADWQGLPLPAGLAMFNRPECLVYVSLDAQHPLQQVQGEVIATVRIPASVALNGAHFFVGDD